MAQVILAQKLKVPALVRKTTSSAMNPVAVLAVAMVSVTSAIKCDSGTVYETGCSWSSTVAEGQDCSSTQDQCYTWTYKLTTGCNYQTKGCDSSASSWCGESYNDDTYTHTCCDSDNCNRDVDGLGSGGGGSGAEESDASYAYGPIVSLAAMVAVAAATF